MRAFAVPALLLFALLAGCAGGSDEDQDDHNGHDDHDDGHDLAIPATPVLFLNITAGNATFRFSSAPPDEVGVTGNVSTTGNATATSANATGNASGNATGSGSNSTSPGGLAPLNVTFTLGASHLPAGTAANWTFDFGRASAANATNGTEATAANGTTLPATLDHSYTAAGTYNVTFILRAGNLTPQALQATIHIANGTGNVSVGKPLPDQLHFEFGESLGCASDANALTGGSVPPNCVSFHGGPDATGIDGHWLELDERYWGLAFVATADVPDGEDSDCFLLAPDATTIVADGHNGGGPCTGVVPEGTGWIFLYPWGTPALGMTLDFAAPAP
jgi:hypothetical protein